MPISQLFLQCVKPSTRTNPLRNVTAKPKPTTSNDTVTSGVFLCPGAVYSICVTGSGRSDSDLFPHLSTGTALAAIDFAYTNIINHISVSADYCALAIKIKDNMY